MWVHGLLDRAHHLDACSAEFRLKIIAFANTDAVLAGAGAAHGQSALDQTRTDVFHLLHFSGIVRVDEQRTVKIAVADVAEDVGLEAAVRIQVGPGFTNAFGQA